MKVKKILPVLLLVVMAVISLTIRNCNNNSDHNQRSATTTRQSENGHRRYQNRTGASVDAVKFDRTTTNLFFTKHAKCRMKCRHISQQEVKDILVHGTVNYNKSNLSNPRGPTYAVEGITNDHNM
jgi:Domain of unknown function (DUF4258)